MMPNPVKAEPLATKPDVFGSQVPEFQSRQLLLSSYSIKIGVSDVVIK